MKKVWILLLLALKLHTSELEDIKHIAKAAGQFILDLRASSGLTSQKTKLSNGQNIYQTNANCLCSQFILDHLIRLYPSYGLLSHDQLDRDLRWYLKDKVWIVQPIDHTRAFAKGSDDFHIQIGLLKKDQPIFGLSYYPAKDTYIWAIENQGAFLQKSGQIKRLIAKSCPKKILIKSSSHSFIQSLLQRIEWAEDILLDECLSSTSRLLKMIEGKASLYLSLGARGQKKKGSICNYAANSIIAKEAGLILTTLNGQALNFREPTAFLTDGVILTSDAELSHLLSRHGKNMR